MNNSIRKSIYKYKRYPHFDAKIHWSKVCNAVENEEYVCKHAFYPFIHYTQKSKKFPRRFIAGLNQCRDIPKEREIMYSCHIDRYIYEYYAYLINTYYNRRVIQDGTNRCSIAYRNNIHKNNISFAKEAFDVIRKRTPCYIVIIDFKGYFDNIVHTYLKERLQDLLGVSILPADYYAVFKSITRYSYINLSDIKKTKNLSRKEWEKQERLFTPTEFRRLKKETLRKNLDLYGIPQGSAISAVLSNVYLLDFDKWMNNYITTSGGLCRRYCDDIIIVFPKNGVDDFNTKVQRVFSFVNDVPNLQLQKDKVRAYLFEDMIVTNCSNFISPEAETSKNIISYLGFSFDGKTISIRQKTIAKYYRKMYRKADTITKRNGFSSKGRRIPMRNIYTLYSKYGIVPSKTDKQQKKTNKGNFLTYVKRAESVFGQAEDIGRDTKKAWEKLQRRLHIEKPNSENINMDSYLSPPTPSTQTSSPDLSPPAPPARPAP